MTTEAATIILSITAGYIVALSVLSVVVRKYARTSGGFVTGARLFPPVLIGLMMASEFIGTSATLGTSQRAYEEGISAAWNVAALAVGFIFFAFLLAQRYKAYGENSISGICCVATANECASRPPR